MLNFCLEYLDLTKEIIRIIFRDVWPADGSAVGERQHWTVWWGKLTLSFSQSDINNIGAERNRIIKVKTQVGTRTTSPWWESQPGRAQSAFTSSHPSQDTSSARQISSLANIQLCNWAIRQRYNLAIVGWNNQAIMQLSTCRQSCNYAIMQLCTCKQSCNYAGNHAVCLCDCTLGRHHQGGITAAWAQVANNLSLSLSLSLSLLLLLSLSLLLLSFSSSMGNHCSMGPCGKQERFSTNANLASTKTVGESDRLDPRFDQVAELMDCQFVFVIVIVFVFAFVITNDICHCLCICHHQWFDQVGRVDGMPICLCHCLCLCHRQWSLSLYLSLSSPMIWSGWLSWWIARMTGRTSEAQLSVWGRQMPRIWWDMVFLHDMTLKLQGDFFHWYPP